MRWADPFGLDYLEFKGGKLAWVFETAPDIFGNSYESGRKEWPANSGDEESKPLAKGVYYTSPKDKEWHPGEEDAWGPFSYRLHETPLTKLKRWALSDRTGGYHIHGGRRPGTGGCIEFADYSEKQRSLHEFDKLMQAYGKGIELC